MNYFKRYNILKWILVVLLVLNISAIGTIIYHVYFDGGSEYQTSVNNEAPLFLKEKMNLNNRQWDDFRRMHARFREESRYLFQEMATIRKEILEEVSKENPDREKLYELADKYGEQHALLKRKTIDHFLGMKDNISPEQERMMNMFLHNMMEQEGPGPGGGPHSRHRFRGNRR